MRYALAMVVVLAACQDDITTVFPDGLEPLEAHQATIGKEYIGY